jgi:hypothetical protein
METTFDSKTNVTNVIIKGDLSKKVYEDKIKILREQNKRLLEQRSPGLTYCFILGICVGFGITYLIMTIF